jgi:chromosome segregation ATPase
MMNAHESSTNTATNNANIVEGPASAIESAASCTAPPAPKRKRKPVPTTAETRVELQELKRVKRKLVKDFDAEKKTISKTFDAEKRSLANEHATELKNLITEHKAAIRALNAEHAKVVKELNASKRHVDRLTTRVDTLLAAKRLHTRPVGLPK